MKLLIQWSSMFLLVLSMVACDKDDDSNPNTTFKADLRGTSEVPANSSTATGTVTLTYNTDSNVFSSTVTHNLTAITGGHIHKGAVGVAGGVVFPFTNISSPISYTSVVLTAAQEADLFANLYYVNLHSVLFPDGEIRGQLIKQ